MMSRTMDMIRKVAPTDANILLIGESGTGKELLAHEIHRLSDRSEEIFIPVDLGAIPPTLFESELFGFAKGAFTDAFRDKPGKIETAERGTLFLDEIGNSFFHGLYGKPDIPESGNKYDPNARILRQNLIHPEKTLIPGIQACPKVHIKQNQVKTVLIKLI